MVQGRFVRGSFGDTYVKSRPKPLKPTQEALVSHNFGV